jgi:hypothetical protein
MIGGAPGRELRPMAAFKNFQMSLALRLRDAFGGHILSVNKVWIHTSINNVCIFAYMHLGVGPYTDGNFL